MITAHLFCVRVREWRTRDVDEITYCTCGAPMDADTLEHARILHRLLHPNLYIEAVS